MHPAIGILGIGTAPPPHSFDQVRALELAKNFCGTKSRPRVLEALYRQSGIRTRGSVLAGAGLEAAFAFYPPPKDDFDCGPTTQDRMARFELEAPPLAERACANALADCGENPARITHLVLSTCTGFFAPGLDSALLQRLALNPGIARAQIGFMGCHGAMNALQVARAFAREDPDARVLLCAVELCTLHMQYGAASDSLIANALFADGAAAAVIGAPSPGQKSHATLSAFGSQLIGGSANAMSWRIGTHGFQMTLSPQVPALIERHLCGWLESWLAKQDTRIGAVAAWAVHPGGPKILDAVERALCLPDNGLWASRQILSDHGNMSSPTILFALAKIAERKTIIPTPCVVLGFGPGLVVEAALLGSKHDSI